VVSPCRDEAAHCERTLLSVASQSVRPDLWVIVDDGSTDDTPSLLAEFAREHDFVQVVRRENRGRRSVGPGVVDAFYAGLAHADIEAFEFVCKLDLDLDLPPTYFEQLLSKFDADPRLGSCSGKPYYRDRSGTVHDEWCSDEIVVGMTKLYRTQCFREIGGFVREVMWDGIDSHRSRMLGWRATSFPDAGMRFEHLRPMGSSQHGVLTGRRRHGFGQYYMGTSLPFLLASAAVRVAQPPYVVGSLAMVWGYLWSWLRRLPQHQDPAFHAFLRRYQRGTLVRGKKATLRALDAESEALWRHRHGAPR
jgi:glycosyltransferase involved in cell wall biosynthesis